MKILLTGGAGYIGSHCLLSALANGHKALVYDNFCNASPEVLGRVQRLSNRDFSSVRGDIRDQNLLEKTFLDFKPDVVIHFAGLKAVGESVEHPLRYYENNVNGSIELLKAMDLAGTKHIVFSSTATVYGKPQYLPMDEKHPLGPENPYGNSKLMVENLIADWVKTGAEKSAVMLRYFNPVGAHESGQIGEDPQGIPNNLMPYIQQVAIGKREKLFVHGDDYDTIDGTGVRDYIHVLDLIDAHMKAVDFVQTIQNAEAINVGTGQGSSVLEVIKSFERVNGVIIPFEIAPRRAGDVAASVAKAAKASELLGWKSKYTLNDMCKSAWGFQKNNPNGYK